MLPVTDANGQEWEFLLKSWANGAENRRVYVLEGTADFMKANRMRSGDAFGICRAGKGAFKVRRAARGPRSSSDALLVHTPASPQGTGSLCEPNATFPLKPSKQRGLLLAGGSQFRCRAARGAAPDNILRWRRQGRSFAADGQRCLPAPQRRVRAGTALRKARRPRWPRQPPGGAGG
jgi:hypothetical protein